MKTFKFATYLASLLLFLIACQGEQSPEVATTTQPAQDESEALILPEPVIEVGTAVIEPTTEPTLIPSPITEETAPTPKPILADEFVASPVVNHIDFNFLGEEAEDQAIFIWFNQDMDLESVKRAITITPILPYSINEDGFSRSIKLNLTSPVQTSVDYEISIATSALNAAGIPMLDRYEAAFTGEQGGAKSPLQPRLGQVPSIVASVQPIIQNSNPTVPIVIDFLVDVDRASVEQSFFIRPFVSGETEWVGNQFVFRPDPNAFVPTLTYEYGLINNARSADGNLLFEKPIVWSYAFQESGAQETQMPFSFGAGANVQTIDANGRRIVEIRLTNRNPQLINASLYRLTPTQFVSEYNAKFQKSYKTAQPNPFDIPTGLPPSIQWQFETAPNVNAKDLSGDVFIPADVPIGAYILELADERSRDTIFLVISENTLTAKGSYGEIYSWLRSSSGEVVPNATMTLFDTAGNIIDQGTNDEMGVSRLAIPRSIAWGDENQLSMVMAQTGDDIVVAGLDVKTWGQERRYVDFCYKFDQWGNDLPLGNQYEIFATTDKPVYQPGQTVQFKAIVRRDNDSLFQVPEAGSSVRVTLENSGVDLEPLELQTNQFGSINGSFTLPNAEQSSFGPNDEPSLLSLEFTIENETIEHFTAYRLEPAPEPFLVKATTDKQDYVMGDDIQIDFQAVDFDGTPLPRSLDYDIFRSVRARRDNHPTSWPVAWSNQANIFRGGGGAGLGEDEVTTVSFNTADLEFGKRASNPLQVGLEVVVTNDRGTARKFLTVEVFDPNREGVERFYSHDDLRISAEKGRYSQDETAVFLIDSTFSGPATLTLERAAVQRMQPVELTAPVTRVEVPLLETDAPNIFASINAKRPFAQAAQPDKDTSSQGDFLYLEDHVEILVPVEQKQLTVEIITDKNDYQPGELANVTVRVTNNGTPVSAELLLTLADINSLPILTKSDATLYDYFYQSEELSISSFSSYSLQRQFGGGGGGGCGGGGISFPVPGITLNANNIWIPEIATDFKGEAEVQIRIPDTSTAWKLSAAAITADTQIGEAEIIIETK